MLRFSTNDNSARRVLFGALALASTTTFSPACTEAPEEVCEGGFDDATCTMAAEDHRQCDSCGRSWICDPDRDPTRGEWEADSIPCECVCDDGGILNASNEGDICYRQVGEHNDEDRGPYRETCEDPSWYEL